MAVNLKRDVYCIIFCVLTCLSGFLSDPLRCSTKKRTLLEKVMFKFRCKPGDDGQRNEILEFQTLPTVFQTLAEFESLS